MYFAVAGPRQDEVEQNAGPAVDNQIGSCEPNFPWELTDEEWEAFAAHLDTQEANQRD